MITLRPAGRRGHFNHGWLDTYHTFSFASYYDPQQMGFRSLRVINEDRVAPGRGFGTHSHSDMEILTYVLEGELAHRDSMGNGSVIRPGDVQRMSAGTGIAHSEFNPSETEPVHFLQIWNIPDRRGIEPSYEQRSFPVEERSGRLLAIAAGDGRDGAVKMEQDVVIYSTILGPGGSAAHDLADGRHAWVQVVRGSVTIDGQVLQAGDGAALSDEPRIEITGVDDAEVLLFDLA
jgi:redox-sensitive bicupin YhaK (pirin superfamily)